MNIETVITAQNRTGGSLMNMLSRPKNTDPLAAQNFQGMLAPLTENQDTHHLINTEEAAPYATGGHPVIVEEQSLQHTGNPEGTASGSEDTDVNNPSGQSSVTIMTPPTLIAPDLPRLALPTDFAAISDHIKLNEPGILSASTPLPISEPAAMTGAPDIQGLNEMAGKTPVPLNQPLQVPTLTAPAELQTGNGGKPSHTAPESQLSQAVVSELASAGTLASNRQPIAIVPSNNQGLIPISPEPARKGTAVQPDALPHAGKITEAQTPATDPLAIMSAPQAEAASAVRSANAIALKPDTSVTAFASVLSAGVFSGFNKGAVNTNQNPAQGKAAPGSFSTAGAPSYAPALLTSKLEIMSQGKATGSLASDSLFVQPPTPIVLKPLPLSTPMSSGMEMVADSGALTTGPGQIQSSGTPQALIVDPARAGTSPQSPATQVGLGIVKATTDGTTRFTIRMDPPDLGRIEVKLHMLKDGGMRALIMADTPETLDLLQRDARALQRMLGESGIKTESDSLNFSLNQNAQDQKNMSFADQADGHGAQKEKPHAQHDSADAAPGEIALQQTAALHWQTGDGLNIVI